MLKDAKLSSEANVGRRVSKEGFGLSKAPCKTSSTLGLRVNFWRQFLPDDKSVFFFLKVKTCQAGLFSIAALSMARESYMCRDPLSKCSSLSLPATHFSAQTIKGQSGFPGLFFGLRLLSCRTSWPNHFTFRRTFLAHSGFFFFFLFLQFERERKKLDGQSQIRYFPFCCLSSFLGLMGGRSCPEDKLGIQIVELLSSNMTFFATVIGLFFMSLFESLVPTGFPKVGHTSFSGGVFRWSWRDREWSFHGGGMTRYLSLQERAHKFGLNSCLPPPMETRFVGKLGR